MKNIKIQTPKGERIVGPGYPVLIIAEAGSNHDGKLEQAKRLIDVAAEAGADMFKLQAFRAETIYAPGLKPIPTPQGPLDLFEFFKKMELPYEWLPELKKYTEERGMVFFVTPFDEEAVEALAKIGVAAFKVASPELNHIPLIEQIARHRKPMIMSTGLSVSWDVEEAIRTAKNQGNDQIVLLHCVSGYPSLPERYNLSVIREMRRAFGVPVGLSDHSMDPVLVPKLAAALGACVVEKHFTIDKTLPGADHGFALNPDELQKMVGAIREVDDWSDSEREEFLSSEPSFEEILGSGIKTISPDELDLYPGDKRSIWAVQDIPAGGKITPSNIRVLRSERYDIYGMHPREYKSVLGKRTSRAVKKNTALQYADVAR